MIAVIPLTYLYAGGDDDLVNVGHVCGEQRDADIAALYRHYDKCKRDALEVELCAAEDDVLAYLGTQRNGSSLTKYNRIYGKRHRIAWAAVKRLEKTGRIVFDSCAWRWFLPTPPASARPPRP